MTILTLRALGVTYAQPLFTDLSLNLSKSDRLGLIAANGRGKSTLLALMAGLSEPTSGQITTARGLRPALVAQNVPRALMELTLYDAVLGGLDADTAESESWRAHIVLEDLRVPQDLWQQPLGTLSGGWQRVTLLARAWISEPDLLLMDEPTNHLDLSRIAVLQDWLNTVARGTPFVVASHDRAFLDAVTNRSLFLRADASAVFALPYSPARDALDEADAAAARQYENDLARAAQLRRQAAKLKNIGINSGSDLLLTKTKQLTGRADQIETAAKPAHTERSAGAIRLNHAETHAKALVTLSETEISAPDGRVLFRAGPLWITPGDRVVVLGANGAGKSCLLSKVVAAIDAPQSDLRIAPSVTTGVVDQQLSHLAPEDTPMEVVTRASDAGDRAARAQLAGAGMEIMLQDTPIARLSGGQKARLAMLLLRLARPGFYVLDEPTNHLDIDGQEALEGELTRDGATALLVSHDRSFVRNLGTRFWQIERKRLIEVDSPEPFFDAQMG